MCGVVAYFCYINRNQIKSAFDQNTSEQRNRPEKYVTEAVETTTQAISTTTTTTTPQPPRWEDNDEIKILRQYLQIRTVQPKPNYSKTIYFCWHINNVNFIVFVFVAEPAVQFLKKQAHSLGLTFSVHYPVDKENPVVVMTWIGSQPELPSIMLNSHMDVVPVFEEHWSHPPFAAEMNENGDIFARGSQDTKSIGIQYLAAIRALKRKDIFQLNRTIHVVFVPDEG